MLLPCTFEPNDHQCVHMQPVNKFLFVSCKTANKIFHFYTKMCLQAALDISSSIFEGKRGVTASLGANRLT